MRVRAELDGPPPDLTAIAGVSNVVVDGHTVECDVSGPMEPLLRALADAGVRHMTTREPSLEELFMSRYGDTPRPSGTVDDDRRRDGGTSRDTARRGPGVRVEAAIARRAFRQVWMGATVWAVVFGATVASSALTYVNSFPDQASRDQLAASTSGDAGFAILLGPISAIDTVGGYTVYKCFVFLTTIGAIWALLAATRLLRGEEDAGRWPLVLAGATRAAAGDGGDAGGAGRRGRGRVRRHRALHPAGGGATPTSASGSASPSSSRLSIAVAPAVFVGGRRVDLAARPHPAGGHGARHGRVRRRLRHAHARRLRLEHPLAAVVDAVRLDRAHAAADRQRPSAARARRGHGGRARRRVGGAGGAARRGAGMLASRDVVPPRRFGLGSPFGLAVRLELPVLVAWCVGAAGAGFAFGIIAEGGDRQRALLHERHARQVRRAAAASRSSTSASRSC